MIKKHLIYVKKNKCNICNKDVILYTHAKKLVCDCGDAEAELTKEVIKNHFVTFEDFLRKEQ